jgi:hypothetical protein
MSHLNKLGMHAPVYAQYQQGANGDLVDAGFFIADDYYEVVDVAESHETAGSDGGAVTLDVKKCPSGSAIAAGTSILASTFDAKSTAATPVRKTVSNAGLAAQGSRLLSPGDRLVIDYTGTLTALAGVVVTAVLKRVRFTTQR